MCVFKSIRIRVTGHVVRMGDKSGPYRNLVGRPEGKRPLGRPRRLWEGNIETSLQEVGREVMDWIDLAQDMESW